MLLLRLLFSVIYCFIVYLVFHLVYCIFLVIVCRFLYSLMAFDCQEIKGFLTYLLTYLAEYLSSEKLDSQSPTDGFKHLPAAAAQRQVHWRHGDGKQNPTLTAGCRYLTGSVRIVLGRLVEVIDTSLSNCLQLLSSNTVVVSVKLPEAIRYFLHQINALHNLQ